jgi:hypothetical protein
MITVSFTRKAETKGTFKYAEDAADGAEKIGTLYIKKPACAELGNPEKITVVISAAK